MKKSIYTLALLFTASTLLTSCRNNEVILVESATLSPYEFSIAMGTPAVTLTATLYPANATNRAVAWTSENANIASVNNGVVTAVSVGTTRIFITTACGRTNTATVTVTPAPIAVTSVALTDCDADTPLVIGGTRQLTATVLPKNATNHAVIWTSDNTSIATVDNDGLVTARAAGTTTITVITTDGGRTAACVVTVTVCQIDNSAGVVIDGIRWATRNVDTPSTFAEYPENAGGFFQWGTLNDVTHHWAATGTVTGWNRNNNRVVWTAVNNPCPQGWRVPTQTELTNLQNQPNTWAQRNGINGRMFGTAPNQLFLPAAGYRLSTSGMRDRVDSSGFFWSNTEGSNAAWAWYLLISNDEAYVLNNSRAYGFSVRCVAE